MNIRILVGLTLAAGALTGCGLAETAATGAAAGASAAEQAKEGKKMEEKVKADIDAAQQQARTAQRRRGSRGHGRRSPQ